jgi:hypothetical protein
MTSLSWALTAALRRRLRAMAAARCVAENGDADADNLRARVLASESCARIPARQHT